MTIGWLINQINSRTLICGQRFLNWVPFWMLRRYLFCFWNDRMNLKVLIEFGLQVCLVYETLESINPKIYLLEIQSNKWQFLAESFSEYLRMCIAHLGLPYWELCFAHTCSLPSWAEQLFLLLAPHLLERNANELQTNRLMVYPREPVIYNELDLSIFRTKPKCSKQPNKFNKWSLRLHWFISLAFYFQNKLKLVSPPIGKSSELQRW